MLRSPDVDSQRNRINLKGNKHRIVPLTDNTKYAIDAWLKGSKHNHISSKAIQDILNNYSDQLEIEITPGILLQVARRTGYKYSIDH